MHRRDREPGSPSLIAALTVGLTMIGLASAGAEPVTRETLASAANDFAGFCAPCHGEDARGGGPAAKSLAVPPADLTTIATRAGGSFPAAAVFEKIEGLAMPDAHGSREMPVWGDVFVGQAVGKSTSLADAKAAATRTEARIRALVDYLETVQTRP